MKSMKRFISLVVAILMALTLFGCTSNKSVVSDSSEVSVAGDSTAAKTTDSSDSTNADGVSAVKASGEVTMWTHAGKWTEIFDMHEKINPDLKLTIVPVDGNDYLSKFLVAYNSGTGLPDIGSIEMNTRGYLLSQKDMWENLEAEPYNLNRDDMLDFLVPMAISPDDKISGIECGAAPGGLIYRRDLALKYFGTDDPDKLAAMFDTWDKLIEAGIKLQKETDGKVFMFPSIKDVFVPMQEQSTIPYLDDNNKLNLDKAILPVLERLKKMLDTGMIDSINQWDPAWYNAMAGENHIFFYGPAWMPGAVIAPAVPETSGKWGLMACPEGAYNEGGTLMSIPTAAANKEGAWELISWALWSVDGAKIVRDKIGYISSYAPVYEDKTFYDIPNDFFGGQYVLNTYIDIAKKIMPRPLYKYDNVVGDAIDMGALSMGNGVSVADALASIKSDIITKLPELK